MVDLETIHGDLTVDDSEVSVTTEFVQKMNARGFKLEMGVGLGVACPHTCFLHANIW